MATYSRSTPHDLTISLAEEPGFDTPNVSAFKHAPMTEYWDKLVTVGIKVEVVNFDESISKSKAQVGKKSSSGDQGKPLGENSNPASTSKIKSEPNANANEDGDNGKVYWIATVVKICGYLAKLRYEGYEEDSSHDFWVYLFSEDVHGVGWCASKGKTLYPPENILKKLPDWTMYLIRRLTGATTLPADFSALIKESLRSRFVPGVKLEVVDKNRVSSVRVATVVACVGGRLLVNYDNAEPEDAGFWTHEKSPLVHPIGWAQFVSHELVATYDYARESLEKVTTKRFSPFDATWDMFDLPSNELSGGLRFEQNMKLEAIDPLNLSSISVATVIKVLRCNYLMIGIDGSMCPTGSDWFCYHATSPYIFPPGFCKKNNLKLTVPKPEEGSFDWDEYLLKTGSRAAPSMLFNKEIPKHGFKEGMLIEAVDLMQSRLVCVATVAKVVGRLLRIHFNGWDESFDQWCDCESPDLFPWGWCKLVDYPLEPPRSQEQDSTQLQSPSDNQKRRKSLPSSKKSSKKKKTSSNPSTAGKQAASSTNLTKAQTDTTTA